jgi:hypothetical protein
MSGCGGPDPAPDKECSIEAEFSAHSQLHKELAEECAVVMIGGGSNNFVSSHCCWPVEALENLRTASAITTIVSWECLSGFWYLWNVSHGESRSNFQNCGFFGGK